MWDLTDEQIVAELRPIIDATRERFRLADIVDRLRLTRDPTKLAERDEAGSRMADLDIEISYDSISALHRIGLWHAAMALSQSLDEADKK